MKKSLVSSSREDHRRVGAPVSAAVLVLEAARRRFARGRQDCPQRSRRLHPYRSRRSRACWARSRQRTQPIVELARQITAVSKFNDLKQGVSGQSRRAPRRHAHQCRCRRGHRLKSMSASRMQNRPPDSIARCTLSSRSTNAASSRSSGGINRMPMERTAGVAALYEKAQEIAEAYRLEAGGSGGGRRLRRETSPLAWASLRSTALGAVGEGAHAVHEYILISELPRRALLLAGPDRGCLSSGVLHAQIHGRPLPARRSLSRHSSAIISKKSMPLSRELCPRTEKVQTESRRR